MVLDGTDEGAEGVLEGEALEGLGDELDVFWGPPGHPVARLVGPLELLLQVEVHLGLHVPDLGLQLGMLVSVGFLEEARRPWGVGDLDLLVGPVG